MERALGCEFGSSQSQISELPLSQVVGSCKSDFTPEPQSSHPFDGDKHGHPPHSTVMQTQGNVCKGPRPLAPVEMFWGTYRLYVGQGKEVFREREHAGEESYTRRF